MKGRTARTVSELLGKRVPALLRRSGTDMPERGAEELALRLRKAQLDHSRREQFLSACWRHRQQARRVSQNECRNVWQLETLVTPGTTQPAAAVHIESPFPSFAWRDILAIPFI